VPELKLVSSIEGPADAPVLVLSNPIGTTRGIWAHQVPVLSRYYRLLRYEPRGHGAPGAQSPAPPGPYTIAELGADLLATLNDYGIERFAFAGVSLGGMTGIWLAANAPERVTALAVCCAALTPLPNAAAWHDRAALVLSQGMAPLADMVVPRWFTPAFLTREPGPVETVTRMLKDTSPAGYAGCGEAIAALDLEPLLPRVKAPTLVISGAADVAAPPAVGARTARGIPGARLSVIQAAGHFAHYEKPGPVTDALLGHFRAALALVSGGDRLFHPDGGVADHRPGRGRGHRGGPHPVRPQDGGHLAGDPLIPGRRGVQAAVRVRVLPLAGQRVHHDGGRIGGAAAGDDRVIGLAQRWRSRRPSGESGQQRDPRTRRRRLDQVHGGADPVAFQSRGHPEVVVSRLDDHQRRLQPG